MITKPCLNCGKEFETRRNRVRYCSRSCYGEFRKGKTLAEYPSLGAESPYQYVMVAGRHTLKHRAVMEANLGRRLRSDEIVHHVNEDRRDNDPTNLELKEGHREHRKTHDKTFRSGTQKECTVCHKIKPNSEFSTNSAWSGTWDARFGDCKLCHAARCKADAIRRKAEWEALPAEERDVRVACRQCGEEKPVAAFHKNWGVQNGPPVRQPCKPCFNAGRQRRR